MTPDSSVFPTVSNQLSQPSNTPPEAVNRYWQRYHYRSLAHGDYKRLWRSVVRAKDLKEESNINGWPSGSRKRWDR